MPELDKKSASVFAGKVVRKDLVRKVKVGVNVPVFVLEYLLGKYCATDDPTAIDAAFRLHKSDEMPKAIHSRGLLRWRRAEIIDWIEAGCPPLKKGGN